MGINIQNLVHSLEQKQNSISSSLDIMQISKAIELLRLNKINYIENFSSLPDVNSLPLGTLYYVEYEEGLYIIELDYAGNRVWRSLVEGNSLTLTWGSAAFGALGDGIASSSRSSPVSILGGFTDWSQIAVACEFMVGLRQNGTLWSWGYNDRGRLGDGTVVNKCSPVAVLGNFSDWCQVSVALGHGSAVRTNGTLWTWGNNCAGRLGDGTTVCKSSPVSVLGGFTDWCQVSNGECFTVAIRTNGTAWAWGRNNNGELGDGTAPDKSSPVSVVGGFTDWCQVSAGDDHVLALRLNGTLWAWGCNNSGRLGDITTIDKSSPISVAGGFTDWCQVAAGAANSAALRTNGTIWTWGCGQCGRLGNNSTTNQCSPVSVVGGVTNWCQISAGAHHVSAIKTDGTLWAWGCNGSGRLGDGTTVDKSSPVSTIGGITNWYKISASRFTTAGIVSNLKKF